MKRHDMLLANGEVVKFNLQDALEVLTETETVILDMLIVKVQDHTEEKAKEAAKQQAESQKVQNLNNLVHSLSKQFGVSPLELLANQQHFDAAVLVMSQHLREQQPETKDNTVPFIFTEYIPQK